MIVCVECVYFMSKLTVHKIGQKYPQDWLVESWTLVIFIYPKENLFPMKRRTMARRLETVVIAAGSLITQCGQSTALGSTPSVGSLLY